MQEILLELEPRDVTGKAVKKLREQEILPAVIHDHGKPSVHVQGDYLAMFKVFQRAGKHHPVVLRASGKTYTALIRDVDIDPKKRQLRHVVFNAVKANEKVETEIPVRIKYADDNESTPAERAGLVVLLQLDAVEVEALPRDLPEALAFDGEKLVQAGDSLTVADLIVPAGVTIKTEPTHPLATVFEPSALQAANDAAGGDATDDVPAEGEEGDTAPEGGDTPSNDTAKEGAQPKN